MASLASVADPDRTGSHHVAAAKVRSAGRAARMPAAPARPRNAVLVRREAQARRSVAALRDRAVPVRPNPRMSRLRVAARPNPPSGPRRSPAPHRLRPRARRSRLPLSEPSHLRRPSDRLAPLPRSANGTGIVPPASVPGSSPLPPKHPQARQPRQLRLRRLSPQHLRPRPSSGLPQARPARPMRSGPPGRVTRSARIASAPVTSVLARMRPPRPLPPRLPHLRRQQQHLRLRRLPQRLRQPALLRLPPLPQPRHLQREPSRRHQLRPHRLRLHLSRQRLPPPSRWMPPASGSTTCAASAGSVVKAAG